MKSSFRRLALSALILWVGAALAWLEAGRILHQHRWVVVDHVVRVEEGVAFSYPFTVELAANYRIELECRRAIPDAALEQALDKDLIADYEVSSKGNPLFSGNTSHLEGTGGANGTSSRLLGRFDAQPNHPYLLRLHFSRSLPVLAATRPTLKVSVDAQVSRPTYVHAAFAVQLALVLAALGAGCLLLALVRRFFPRRTVPG